MKYIVKREDIRGEIAGYPIEIIQAAVDRGVEQGGNENSVIRSLQYSTSGGFSWSETPEGHSFLATNNGQTQIQPVLSKISSRVH